MEEEEEMIDWLTEDFVLGFSRIEYGILVFAWIFATIAFGMRLWRR